MASLSRYLRRWEPVRVAAATVGGVSLALLAAYVVGIGSSQPTIGGVIAAAIFLAIAVTGFLYAWRLGAGGTLD